LGKYQAGLLPTSRLVPLIRTFIESRPFGVHGRNAAIVTGIALLLSVTAVAAACWPARRASKVNPLEALRYE